MIFKDKSCIVDLGSMRFIRFISSDKWPIPLVENEEGGIGRAYGECIDCREVGGDIFKPDFWID